MIPATVDDAARTLHLKPNAPKELIEEAYWQLIARTKDLRAPERDARITELADAYAYLCARAAAPAGEEPQRRRRRLPPDPLVSECYDLLAVQPDADADIIRLALQVQAARPDPGDRDGTWRSDVRRAGAVLLAIRASGPREAEEIGEPETPPARVKLAREQRIMTDGLETADIPRSLRATVVSTRYQQLAALVFLGAMAFGFVTAPLTTFIAITALLTAIYIGTMAYKAMLVVRSVSWPCDTPVADEDVAALRDADLPVYTVLVPLYHEANIVERIVHALGRLDYPAELLDVKLLLEEDDGETRQAAERLALPPHIELLTIPDTGEPKGKPRACNFGLKHARGDYLVLYDAEDVPDPLQLKKAVLAFRQSEERVGCVQAKLNYFNSNQNLLTRWFTVEYSTWFDLYLPGLNHAAAPIPLGGTSNHFPTDVLRAVGGWDAFNVTEDADLGTRMARFGFRTVLIDSWTLEEANSRVGNWVRQRSRWVKGYMQTWLVHMRNPFALFDDLGPWGFVAFQVMILGTFFVYFANPVFWLLIAVWYGTHASFIQSLYPAPVLYLATLSLFAGNFFFLVIGMMAVIKRGYFEGVKYVLMSYVYWTLMSVAAWKALYQLITRPHYWEKTRHGFARPHAVTVGGEAE